MRVLIVDDHATLRQGLISCLQRQYPEWALGEAGSINEAKSYLRNGWDLLLLDMSLPDGSGLSFLTFLHGAAPQTKVIVLTGLPEKDYAIPALEAGAAGFVTKAASINEVIVAIEDVLAGRRHFSRAVVERLLARSSNGTKGSKELSARELEVLQFVADGFSSREIGEIIHISDKTVETYRARIRKKLDLDGVAGMVRFATERELMMKTSG